jgi:hypothetical protein
MVMASEVEKYLAGLNGAAPDMAALQKLGVSLDEAIAICAKAHKPEPFLNLAAYVPPRSAPAIPEPAKPLTDDDVDCAQWQLAQLCDMISRGESCVTLLCNADFSESTAKELAGIIRRSTRRRYGIKETY